MELQVDSLCTTKWCKAIWIQSLLMLWIVPTLRDGYALAVVFREYTKPEVHGKFQTWVPLSEFTQLVCKWNTNWDLEGILGKTGQVRAESVIQKKFSESTEECGALSKSFCGGKSCPSPAAVQWGTNKHVHINTSVFKKPFSRLHTKGYWKNLHCQEVYGQVILLKSSLKKENKGMDLKVTSPLLETEC